MKWLKLFIFYLWPIIAFVFGLYTYTLKTELFFWGSKTHPVLLIISILIFVDLPLFIAGLLRPLIEKGGTSWFYSEIFISIIVISFPAFIGSDTDYEPQYLFLGGLICVVYIILFSINLKARLV